MTPIPAGAPKVARAQAGAQATSGLTAVRRAIGAVGLVGVAASAALLSAFAASAPTRFVPATIHGGFPSWLSGPLHSLALGRLSDGRFQVVLLSMSAAYVLVLASGRSLRLGPVLLAVGIAQVGLLLCPVLLSQDAFGYVSFARLGALHGLDPYSHTSASAPGDAVFRYLGWRDVASPYGPLYTLGSYALAPLGVAGGLWAVKAVALITSLATVALVALTARRVGRSAAEAAAFVGLNPVLLVFALGGAHNDTLLVALLAAALLLCAGARWGRGSLALVTAVGVKVSAGLVLPFLILGPQTWRARARALSITSGALMVLVAVALIGFGDHALGFIGSLHGEQQMVATHSVPNETARLLGLPSEHGLPLWWRDLWLAGFVAALALTLWRTARGSDWRVGAAWATIALLLCTAWLLPWYAIWVLPLVAVAGDRRLRGAALLLCAYAVAIRLPATAALLGGPRS